MHLELGTEGLLRSSSQGRRRCGRVSPDRRAGCRWLRLFFRGVGMAAVRGLANFDESVIKCKALLL